MNNFRWKIAQFFEKKWWQSYLKNKDAYTYLKWKKNYWSTFLRELHLKNNIKTPILDVGCGPAGVFIVLKGEITALDPLVKEYEKLTVFSTENYPNVEFVAQDFESFATEKKFQTIFCLNAINHFKNIDESFKKLKDLLENNGQLILSVDAHNYTFFRKLFALLPFDILHPHQYNLAEYEQFLIKNGFKVQFKFLKKKEFFFSYWVLVIEREC